MDMFSCFYDMEDNNNCHYIFDTAASNYASNLLINAAASPQPLFITATAPSQLLPAAEGLLNMHTQEPPMEPASIEIEEANAMGILSNNAWHIQNNFSSPSLELALRAGHLLLLPVAPTPRVRRSETQKWRAPDAELVSLLLTFKSQSKFDYFPHPSSLTVAEADVYGAHPTELLNSAQAFICLTSYCRWGPRYTRLRRTKDGYRWKQQGRAFTIVSNGLPRANKTYLSYRSPPSSNHQQEENRKPCMCGKRKYAAFTMEEIALTEDVLHEKIQISNGELPTPFPIICRISDHSKGTQRCLCSTTTSTTPTSSSSSSNESIIQNQIKKALLTQPLNSSGNPHYYNDVSSTDAGSTNANNNNNNSISSSNNVLSPSSILLSDILHSHILHHQLLGSSVEEQACFYSLM